MRHKACQAAEEEEQMEADDDRPTTYTPFPQSTLSISTRLPRA